MKTLIGLSLIAGMILTGCATQDDSNIQRISSAVAESNRLLAQYDTPPRKISTGIPLTD